MFHDLADEGTIFAAVIAARIPIEQINQQIPAALRPVPSAACASREEVLL
jgi:hypothetical protein